MDRTDVLHQVATELAHIPSWPGEHQGLLRAIYRLLRENSLGATGTGSAREVLGRSAAIIRRDYPTATLDYDRLFFDD